MIKTILHKTLSIVFVFTILFPLGVSFAHAFEKHHFEDCSNSLQFHSHENNINCSVYHYTPSFQTTENNNTFSVYIPKIILIEVVPIFSTPIISSFSPKQLRAPPIFC